VAAPKKYPDDLRQRAVRLYRESDPKPVIKRLAEQLNVHPEALRNWIRQAEADTGERADRPTTEMLCAGYNRSTLLTSANQPYNVPSVFYQDTVTNHYSRKIHAQMADGKAYGFAFNDVGANESLVHDGSPQQAYITLDPLS
jgi:transposase-like protein